MKMADLDLRRLGEPCVHSAANVGVPRSFCVVFDAVHIYRFAAMRAPSLWEEGTNSSDLMFQSTAHHSSVN